MGPYVFPHDTTRTPAKDTAHALRHPLTREYWYLHTPLPSLARPHVAAIPPSSPLARVKLGAKAKAGIMVGSSGQQRSVWKTL